MSEKLQSVKSYKLILVVNVGAWLPMVGAWLPMVGAWLPSPKNEKLSWKSQNPCRYVLDNISTSEFIFRLSNDKNLLAFSFFRYIQEQQNQQ